MSPGIDEYRALLDNLPDGFLRCVPVRDGDRISDFIIDDINVAFARAVGASRDLLLNRLVSDAVPGLKETEGAWLAPYVPVAREGTTVVVERQALSLGRWYEVTAFRDASGAVVVLFHDVTERKRISEALRHSEERYRSLFEHSIDAIYVVTPDGKSIEANQAWLDMFGCTAEELSQASASEFYAHPEERDDFLRRMAEHGRVQDVVRFRRRDGTLFDCERSVVALRNECGEVALFQGLHRDITERRLAEQSLRETVSTARALLDATSDAACLMDLEGTMLSLNEEMARRLCGRPEDLVGKRAWDILPPEVVSGRKARAEEVIRTRKPVRFEDVRAGRRIDSIVWPVLDSEGKVARFAVYGRDVTEERRAEQALRDSREELQSLAAHQQDIREQERIGIARELHDQMGQQLTVLKMDLHRARKRLSEGSPVTAEDLTRMIGYVDHAANDVRRISSELRPGVLDDFGLVAAIEWLATQFQEHTGISCRLEISVDESGLEKTLSTALFRVLQELLTNVAKHAGADLVLIGLALEDSHLVLTVADNGRGITNGEEQGHMSLGLIGMRERVRPYGGRLEFRRPESGGTEARVRIPVDVAAWHGSVEPDGV